MECLLYEYCTIRFVADIEREEFVNVGLLMMSKRSRWMSCRILVDESRIAALAPRADLARLRSQLRLFESCEAPEAQLSVEERYRWLAAVKSALIQTSPSHPGIIPLPPGNCPEAADMLLRKFNALFRRLVASPA